MKNKRGLKIFFDILVGLLMISSLAEVFFGFIPVDEDNEIGIRFFFMALSFLGAIYEIISHLFSNVTKSFTKITKSFTKYLDDNTLDSAIQRGLILSKENRIDSAVLLEIENDLNLAFGIVENKAFYIIIVTSCVNMNEAPYVDTIWRNISKGYKYMYITPDSDQDFIDSFITIFADKGFTDLLDVYNKVVENISHICDERLFDVLPDCFDLCLYFKDVNGKLSIDDAKGFCCYQNELIALDDRNCAFYYTVSRNVVSKIFNRYSNAFKKELIVQSYLSKSITRKNSGINGQGLFCKFSTKIGKDTPIIIKGGHELHKCEMSSSKFIDSYLPIDNDLYLAAKTDDEESQVKVFINHSCAPNMKIKNKRIFVSMFDINEGEELTVDYAFIDNEPYRFKCTCGQPSCRRIVTGYDWQLKTVQEKYERNCFSNYIQSKIEAGIAFDVRQSIDKQIKTLRTSVFVEELGFKTENEFSEDENNYKHCCLYKNGQLVAYARVLIKGSVAHISRVAVKQDERHKGYGRQIIFWAETEALKCGVSNAQINALDSIRTFYEKLNYTPLGDVFISEEKSHIKMKKILSLDA